MTSLLLLALVAADPAPWWSNYGDPELNRLINQALAHNLDLQSAAQRIAESRALAGESRSKLLPGINATSGAQRLRGGFSQGIARIPQSSGQVQSGSFVSPFETGLLQGGLDMKWELDLFGSNRAGLAAARADVQATEQRRDDLALSISAEVARVYIQLRGYEERLAITRRTIDAQRQLLELTDQRVKAGLASQLDSERQRLLLTNTEATLPPLEADQERSRQRLAVLLGDEALVKAPLANPGKPLVAPLVKSELPSELLKRRPDVREAEAKLAAELARLKQSKTDLYPKINLNGLLGRQGTSVSSLAFGGGNFFSLGPQLQLPIFSGGRIKSNIAAHQARVEQQKMAYRNELLVAFEEAANAITNLERQREREGKLADAAQAARTSLSLSRDLQQAGLNDFLAVLDSERSLLDAEFQQSLARTQVLVESVSLYKALAGGWPQ